jgi:hypothetical protein
MATVLDAAPGEQLIETANGEIILTNGIPSVEWVNLDAIQGHYLDLMGRKKNTPFLTFVQAYETVCREMIVHSNSREE